MIKTQVITETSRELNFPILMESLTTDTVVLFTSEKTGTVVKKGEDIDEVGYYSRVWLEASNTEYWKVFEGELRLSND
ncbi:MAG: hypothetical protein HRU18_26035 [Pseudoalteromonas sp.]|uniref:hypothetical protein n=1 Tax=Pseudoalteromonas sp. TaxID=53249 RepID=UPI001D6D4E3D|nr:hypothetical protein [Pseudoalteromonas sp.]NRA81674.1 hypothetical protein [Pseudoalteromonas sp.]